MKHILSVIVALLMISCTSRTPEILPKYRFGSSATITDGFYKGYSGFISDYKHCATVSNDGDWHDSICYTVIVRYENQTTFANVPETLISLQ